MHAGGLSQAVRSRSLINPEVTPARRERGPHGASSILCPEVPSQPQQCREQCRVLPSQRESQPKPLSPPPPTLIHVSAAVLRAMAAALAARSLDSCASGEGG